MQSNRCLVFFLFGLSMLPKIYSDGFPPLVLYKQGSTYTTYYNLFKGIIYSGRGQTRVEFFALPEHLSGYFAYNACPVEAQHLHWNNALEIKGKMISLPRTTLKLFVKGLFHKYNCEREIKPVALKHKHGFGSELPSVIGYAIGFLVYTGATGNPTPPYTNVANEQLPGVYHLVELLTVKLNKELGMIYSVSHKILSGKYLHPDLVFNHLPPIETNAEEYGFDVDSLYKEENQRNILYSIFGQFKLQESLIKVQLAPHKDFLLETWKLSSFMNLNTTAMWKQTYSQWKNIEEFVRKVAREMGDLSVETGTAEILKLHNVSRQLQHVYLGGNRKLPVAKYIFKAISTKIIPSIPAILIVMHNDPYSEHQDPICNMDMDNDYGWSVSNDNFKTGLTYVCPLNEDIARKLGVESIRWSSVFKLNNMLKLDLSNKDEEMG